MSDNITVDDIIKQIKKLKSQIPEQPRRTLHMTPEQYEHIKSVIPNGVRIVLYPGGTFIHKEE